MNMASSTMSLVPVTRKSNYTIASILGDGIGIEVIAATLRVLNTLTKALNNAFNLTFNLPALGQRLLQANGRIPAQGRARHTTKA